VKVKTVMITTHAKLSNKTSGATSMLLQRVITLNYGESANA
jgi:hypothetical protein